MAVKQCKDPIFFGTAIYALVGAEMLKLSRLEQAQVFPSGAVRFGTQNNTYLADFTDQETRQAFLDTCRTIGRLTESEK